MSEKFDEKYEYENILERMLDKISDDIDKREGSIIYNALAPAALELADMYVTLKYTLDLTFADTAVEEYLDKIAGQIGMIRYVATKAIKEGKFYDIDNKLMNIDIGKRFVVDKLTFSAIEQIETGKYKMECETAGRVGNDVSGNMVAIEYIDKLGRAELGNVLVPGEDTETDDELRTRYYQYVKETPFAGNISDYKQKVKSIDGVGLASVITATATNNTEGKILINILNSDLEIASQALINQVQNIIDPEQDGNGVGLAPIGHKVTIRTSSKSIINVKTTVTLADGIQLDNIKLQIKNAINKYYKTVINSEWEKESWTVRISQIENQILNLEGIIDITNTSLYNAELSNYKGNISFNSYQIPVIEEVTINVST